MGAQIAMGLGNNNPVVANYFLITVVSKGFVSYITSDRLKIIFRKKSEMLNKSTT